jgi:hypothetical protein
LVLGFLIFAQGTMATDGMPWSAGAIPVRFSLEKPGYVTLVIEDANGRRVRNLLAEEKFAAGEHTVYWDGADGADVHLHKTRGTLVNPGQYVVRGLVRDELKLIYEFAVYNPGHPPWGARDNKTGLNFGRWLSDHNQPSGALFLPNGSPAGKASQLMFCAGGAEWGDGFMWLDLDGRKLHGQRWAGGVFAGAERLARDAGSDGVPGVYAYSIKGKREKNKKNPDAVPQVGVQIMAFTDKKDAGQGQAPFEDVRVLGQDRPLQGRHAVAPGASPVSGIAAWNGLVVVSAVCDDQLLLIDAKKNSDTTETTGKKGKKGKEGGSLGEEIGTVELVQPRGLVFNEKGDLFALSGAKLLLFPDAGKALRAKQLPQPRVLVERGLDEPTDVTLDKDGNLYVSDRGTHQVKVFSPEGKPLRTLGKPGGVQLGNYDEQRMFNPAQVAVTSAGEVWVAENSFTPRRISRWKADGAFVRAYYGPPGYGGGGRITPDGKSVIYCHGDPWNAQATLAFDLDWGKGTGTLRAITHWADLPDGSVLKLPGGHGPATSFEHQGKRYFHNASYLQGCIGELGIWMERDGKLVPVAALGQPADWKRVLLSDAFKGKLPPGVDPNGTFGGGPPFAWADLNDDGKVQPNELRWYQPESGKGGRKKVAGFTVQSGFVLLTADGKRMEPIEFTKSGIPIYDWDKTTPWAKDAEGTKNIGGMVQLGEDGTIMQFGVPIVGWKNGARVWTYPCEWQGVHASHASLKPRWGGDISSGMKNPGPLFKPRRGDAGQMWALSSNWGCVHLGTSDGLYVGTVMRDARTAEGWPASVKRGDNVNDYTNGQESFGVSLQQLDDGRIILSVGGEMIGLCRLEGLDSVRRLPRQTVTVGPSELQAALKMQADLRAEQKAAQDSIKVRIDEKSRPATATLADWKDADWAIIEKARIPVGMGTKPMEMKGAMRVCGDRLHVAWLLRNGANFLDNSVETPASLFKSGAALDLMLGAAGADAGRKNPVAGDQRILIARTPGQKGTLTAMLYRQKSSTPGNKQTFSSPWRSIEFDDVREITPSVAFKESPPIPDQPTDRRLYEVSIPLELLGLKVKQGTIIRGDIGYLRGTPGQTSERVYWHNKVTGLIADVPGEALLDPARWGTIEFATGK